MKNRNRKKTVISKRYRLKPSAHRKLNKACKILNLSCDFMINRTMHLLLEKPGRENIILLNNQGKEKINEQF